MKNKIRFPNKAVLLMLTTALLMLTIVQPVRAQPHQKGPRMDTKYMKMYFSATAEWTALTAGDIDVMDVPLSPAQISQLPVPGVSVENAGNIVTQIITAYRTGWKGIINQKWTGVKNWYTGLMAYKTGVTTLKVGLHTTIDSLNPVTAPATSDVDWNVLWEIYDPLLRLDPYTLTNPVPMGLADNWSAQNVFDAQQSITVTMLMFHLRTNALWHDGSAVTPNDVKFSIDYHQAQFGTFYSNVMNVNRVTIAGSNWVEVYMNGIYPFLPTLRLVGSVPIIQKNIWQIIPNAFAYDPVVDDANGNAVVDIIEDGSGPWIFDSWLVDDYINLVANRNWYLTTGPDDTVNTPTIYDPGDVERCVMEAFHRLGDADYDADLDIWDLIIISFPFSSLPYQSAPWWFDDQYTGLMYSPYIPGDPYITGWALPFDWIGNIGVGTNWYHPINDPWAPFAPLVGLHPWKTGDLNYDNYVNLIDIITWAINWGPQNLGRRAGSGW